TAPLPRGDDLFGGSDAAAEPVPDGGVHCAHAADNPLVEAQESSPFRSRGTPPRGSLRAAVVPARNSTPARRDASALPLQRGRRWRRASPPPPPAPPPVPAVRRAWWRRGVSPAAPRPARASAARVSSEGAMRREPHRAGAAGRWRGGGRRRAARP